MLEDQDFTKRTTVALGTDFFVIRGELDYGLTMAFRNADNVHAVYDFHLWDVDTDEVRERWDQLQAWGAPVTFGKLFPAAPNAHHVREILRLLNGVAYFHSRQLSTLYRVAGRKDVSRIEQEILLSALRIAAVDAAPNSLDLNLHRLQINWPNE